VTSGDGFITLADGSRRWGRFGAAGVLLRHRGADGDWYFLALRSAFTHKGGTWALPGGAIDRHETPEQAAVREFVEEIGVALDAYEIAHVYEDDHGGWSYWTVVVDVTDRFERPLSLNWETEDARWVRHEDLDELPLFDAFAATVATLREQGVL
jgi:8-oxo-dGTP diphosphatase